MSGNLAPTRQLKLNFLWLHLPSLLRCEHLKPSARFSPLLPRGGIGGAAAAATVLRANAVKCSPTHSLSRSASLPLSVSSSSSPELGLRKNTWIGSRSHQLRKIAAVDSLHAAGRDGGRGDEGRSAAVVRLSVRVLPSSVRRQNKSGAALRAPRTHSLTRGKGKEGRECKL